ncbi:MAG: hypothetical protein IAE82_01480 [Opitutaceae bacterium]|nr:hypothetical protein [Opitutaceae bacterium]
MSSRPASPPPISRWPFYAGVAVLLILAASILLYADRPFSAPVMVVTLVSACLGIALGILPEMLDAERRIRVAEAAVRDAADAQLRRLAQTADQLAHVVSRGQSTEEQAGRALGTLEEVAERMVAQAEELAAALTRTGEREQAAHAEELQRLVDERDQKLTALEIRLNATSVALSETQAAIKKSSTSNARSLEALTARLEAIAGELREAIAARPAAPAPSAPEPATPFIEEPAAPREDMPVSAFASESPAIESMAPAAEPEPEAATSPTAAPAGETIPAAAPAVVSVDSNDVAESAVPPESTPEGDEPPPARPVRKPRNHRHAEKLAHEPTAAAETAPVLDEAAPRAEAETTTIEPPSPASPLELALEGMPEPRPVMRLNRREPPGSTSLVATAYIGIGNKLYLRGDGPGLSWERGVPMQFLAIGKWGWTTTDAAVPVTCRVYRNDDTPMLEENIVIDPGTKSEITPKF